MPSDPITPGPGSAPASTTALTPAEAAAGLGITEDEVLIRQHRGELPAHLTEHGLRADAAAPASDVGATVVPIRAGRHRSH